MRSSRDDQSVNRLSAFRVSVLVCFFRRILSIPPLSAYLFHYLYKHLSLAWNLCNGSMKGVANIVP